MSQALRIAFLVHAAVDFLFGILLFLIPGRLLQWVGWKPIDPIISRVLGAALLALAWSSFRGWRAAERSQVVFTVEMEAAFTVLGCIALLRHLLSAPYPAMVWIVFAIMGVFAVTWIVFLVRQWRQQVPPS
ncbi:MAG: hypothetical protein JSV36_00275 [Anaerolineae bacterium]|nr:MAG: hypothetical protein JSV36_00275 [Anaerolineae bacterium]